MVTEGFRSGRVGWWVIFLVGGFWFGFGVWGIFFFFVVGYIVSRVGGLEVFFIFIRVGYYILMFLGVGLVGNRFVNGFS